MARSKSADTIVVDGVTYARVTSSKASEPVAKVKAETLAELRARAAGGRCAAHDKPFATAAGYKAHRSWCKAR